MSRQLGFIACMIGMGGGLAMDIYRTPIEALENLCLSDTFTLRASAALHFSMMPWTHYGMFTGVAFCAIHNNWKRKFLARWTGVAGRVIDGIFMYVGMLVADNAAFLLYGARYSFVLMISAMIIGMACVMALILTVTAAYHQVRCGAHRECRLTFHRWRPSSARK